MAVQLPNGIILALATAYANPLTVTGATNAAETVLSVVNTYSVGDLIEFTSGWSRANGRIFRIKSATGTTVVLEELDTTDTTLFPAGSGTGTIRKINIWTQIQQVTEVTSSGGEPQFVQYEFLENDYQSQIPSTTTAQSIAITVADDPTLAGYAALKKARDSRKLTAMRATLPQGGYLLYNGYVSFDETPSMTKGQLMACRGSFALQGRPVRYSTS
ncbi:MAG: phage tail protein [Pseudomonadota bacterium]